jgi:hypothetical protein
MNVTDAIERRLLFGIARVLCMMFLIGALAAIVVSGIAIYTNGRGGRSVVYPAVSATEVLAGIPGSETANDLLSNAPDSDIHVPDAAGFVIPPALDSILTGDGASQAALNNWLGNVPEGDRQQFLTELSAVVALATQHAATWEWDNRQRYVDAAMTQYAHMKIDRVVQAKNEQAAIADRREQYRESVGVLLGIIGILTLLSVSLAIERNTRSAVLRKNV